jgi:hypothetical protein
VDISVDNDQNGVVRTHLDEGVFDAINEVSVVDLSSCTWSRFPKRQLGDRTSMDGHPSMRLPECQEEALTVLFPPQFDAISPVVQKYSHIAGSVFQVYNDLKFGERR